MIYLILKFMDIASVDNINALTADNVIGIA
jgi:hypothetical protein